MSKIKLPIVNAVFPLESLTFGSVSGSERIVETKSELPFWTASSLKLYNNMIFIRLIIINTYNQCCGSVKVFNIRIGIRISENDSS
jgi:hypothetical protein